MFIMTFYHCTSSSLVYHLNYSQKNLCSSETGASSWECSSTYRGSSAASEPETQAVQAHGQKVAAESDLVVWLTFHTTANAYLTPYGNNDEQGECDRSPSHDEIVSITPDET